MSTTKKIEVKSAPIISKSFAPVIIDIIMLAIGICLLIWADKVLNAISMAIGIVFILYAIYNFIAYIRIEEKRNRDLPMIISAIALLISGIFLVARADFIKEVISFIVGAYLIIVSFLHIQDSIALSKLGNKTPLILSIVGLICGVLCILGRIAVPDLMVKILGAILIIFAFSDIVGVSMIKAKRK